MGKKAKDGERERKKMHSEPRAFLQHLQGWLVILDSNVEKDKLHPVWKGLNIMIQSPVNEV